MTAAPFSFSLPLGLLREGVDVDLLVGRVQQVVSLLAALCGWVLVSLPCAGIMRFA